MKNIIFIYIAINLGKEKKEKKRNEIKWVIKTYWETILNYKDLIPNFNKFSQQIIYNIIKNEWNLNSKYLIRNDFKLYGFNSKI